MCHNLSVALYFHFLWLQVFNGVFLKVNKATVNMLHRVEPYVTYGYAKTHYLMYILLHSFLLCRFLVYEFISGILIWRVSGNWSTRGAMERLTGRELLWLTTLSSNRSVFELDSFHLPHLTLVKSALSGLNEIDPHVGLNFCPICSSQNASYLRF